MEYVFQACDVAAAIEGALAGEWTKAQLGKWAHQVMLRHDAGTMSINHTYSREINEALYRLLMMTEGPEYELTDAELHALMEQLNQLGSPSQRV